MSWFSNLLHIKHLKLGNKKHSFLIKTGEEEFFIECFKTWQTYSFTEKIDSTYQIMEGINKHPIIHIEGNIYIFPPSGCSIEEKKDKLKVFGKVYRSGHKVYLRIKLRERIKGIEPILSSNKFYPNNSICGFVLSSLNVKYIIYFGYSDWCNEYKACVLKYSKNKLEVLTYDIENDTMQTKKNS